MCRVSKETLLCCVTSRELLCFSGPELSHLKTIMGMSVGVERKI